MNRSRASRRDAMESAIESALRPGHFIGWNQGTDFVSGVCPAEREIGPLTDSDPARAVGLYDTFIAACNLKVGTFAGELFRG